MKRILFALIASVCLSAPLSAFQPVLLEYQMGDYYNARDALDNFLYELAERTSINVNAEYEELALDDERIFEHYFLILNGHVELNLSDEEKENLRAFLLNGGFLLANDDYGLDESFREMIAEVFPEYTFERVAYDHEIYHSFYDFDDGLPKIHEHDRDPAEGWGLFIDGRLAAFYVYSSDIIDGWDHPEIHDDPPEKREQSFQMGVNIVVYALTH